MSRDRSLDSIKGFLIFFIVYGHLIELSQYKFAEKIYQIIYIFHMPVFMLIAGINSALCERDILKNIFRYFKIFIIWEILYRTFLYYLYGSYVVGVTPYWIIWFLLVMFYYQTSLLLIRKFNISFVLMISLGLSIIAIMIPKLSYALSGQRAFYFYFFFVLGVYLKDKKILNYLKCYITNYKEIALYCCVILTISIVTLMQIPRGLLYGSLPADSLGLGFVTAAFYRAFLIVLSLLLAFFIFHFFYKYHVNFLTSWGKNSFVIFLFHGFFVIAIRHMGFLQSNNILDIFIAAILALGICFLLGRDYFSLKLSDIKAI